MRIMGQAVSSMYVWAIALLTALVAISSYMLRIFPWNAVAAVAIAVVLDLLVARFYHRRKPTVPWTAMITGLIIGSVAPSNASMLLILLAVAVAIAARTWIRIKHVNIFNPAALGLLVALVAFSAGSEWWTSVSYNAYGIAIPLSIILVIASYEAKRLSVALSAVAVAFVLGLVLNGLGSIVASLLGINYFFALVMVTEPRTSPVKNTAQAVYGALVAALVAVLAYIGFTYPFLVALLLGNLAYAYYRARGNRLY